jgi:hypothetical protein
MIVTKPVGGLANQLCIYTAAKSIAKSKGVEVQLDLSHFNGQSKFKFRFDELNLNYNVISSWRILLKHHYFTFYSNRILRHIAYKMDKYGIKGSKVFSEKELRYDSSFYDIPPSSYLSGNFLSYLYYRNVMVDIKNEFKPRKLSKKAIKLIDDVKGNNFASIHFRRGDYLAEKHTRDFHGLLGIDYYKSAINWLLINKNITKFYIFTDDVELAKEAFSFLEDAFIVDRELGISDIEELELMKNINSNVLANSGFSRWAGLLNYNEDPTIVLPRDWFKGINFPTEEVGPKNWIRIDSHFETF